MLCTEALNYLYQNIVRLSLRYECPIFCTIVYVIWVQYNNRKLAQRKPARPAGKKNVPQGKSLRMKALMLAHNTLMSLFSLLIFTATSRILLRNFRSLPLREFITDSRAKIGDEMSVWVWVFYISKYYEFVDTLILFKTGKPSSFLQMYHHAGAIIACWLLCMARTHAAWVFVVLNSFIHTLMYFYYGLTVLGMRPPFKRCITIMQIGQFFLGNIIGFIFVLNKECYSKDLLVRRFQLAAFTFNFCYVLVLIFLFLRFQRERYAQEEAPSARKRAGAVRTARATSLAVSKSLEPLQSPVSSASAT
jgi:GNS1/SUR4 family